MSSLWLQEFVKASPADNGEYYCEAFNIAGPAQKCRAVRMEVRKYTKRKLFCFSIEEIQKIYIQNYVSVISLNKNVSFCIFKVT